MDDKIQSVLDKVEKLLRLASNNPSEEEAAAATEKAQNLLVAYNLGMEDVNGRVKKGDRKENKLSGGLYKWQRNLWNEVAKMNFCKYWFIRGLERGSKYQHRLIGRNVNILSTKLMAEYLQEAIERIARDYYSNDPKLYFSKAAIAYREGMSDSICNNLMRKRWEKEREDEENKKGNTTNALTIVGMRKSEEKENERFEYDLRNGEGAYDKRAEYYQELLRKAKENRIKAEEEERKFREEHPEEYARMEAEKKRREEIENKKYEQRARRRSSNYREPKKRHEDYYKGRVKGESVSIDQQIDKNKMKKIG